MEKVLDLTEGKCHLSRFLSINLECKYRDSIDSIIFDLSGYADLECWVLTWEITRGWLILGQLPISCTTGKILWTAVRLNMTPRRDTIMVRLAVIEQHHWLYCKKWI